MEQSTILKYAIQHLGNKIERLNDNLTMYSLSKHSQMTFENNLAKYTLEYDEMTKMLDELGGEKD